MLHNQLNKMFEHHYWTNQLLFTQIENLTEKEYTASTDFPHGGIRDTLVHLLYADIIWRKRLMAESFTAEEITKLYEESKSLPFLELQVQFAKEKHAMLAYLDTLDNESLQEEFNFQNTIGDKYTEVRIDILTHVIMHAMQHASELAQMLTVAGFSPGEIDFRGWVHESQS